MPSSTLFKIADVLPFVGGRMLHGNPEMQFSNFCIDSRYVEDRSLFVPLMGQSRDGHQYIIDAINKGAVAAFVRSGHHQIHEIISYLRERASHGGQQDYADVCIIEVRHTLVALQKVAEWYRQHFEVKVVGITGSVGKTGTKEMLIQLLSNKMPTVGTEKNFNNEIGVPLALSKITTNTKVAVIEMAMRARGEISLLSRIARPELAIITNTYGSHVGRLGSFEEVYKAKSEIADGLKPGGIVVLNKRDEYVHHTVLELRTKQRGNTSTQLVFFDPAGVYENAGIPPFMPPGAEDHGQGGQYDANLWVEDMRLLGLEGSEFTLCSNEERVKLHLSMLGRGAAENLTAAAAVAVQLGLSLQDIADAAPDLLPAPQRVNLYKLDRDLYLIDDCYNSSPASCRDSLELMLSISPKYRKVLVLGDMLELGKYETLFHRQLALAAMNLPFQVIYAVGPRMNAVNEVEGNDEIELYYIEGHANLDTYIEDDERDTRFGGAPRFQPREELVILDDRAAGKLSALLQNHMDQRREPTVILIKGSRALHLERIVNDLLDGTSLS
jgi:UDP-N-acetylmuramoyl-tripeptide--D-alanyl-D-alanine ligase